MHERRTMTAPSDTSKSSGNEGSRGSRGQANSGAHDGTAANDGDEAARAGGTPDLHGENARGGGGIGSGSSRSVDLDESGSKE
jgi:hypothetical protein